MENTKNNNQLNQVYLLLKYVFVIVPIVAGIDKFTNILTNWEQYINPSFDNILPFSGAAFIMSCGIVEIIAGILVLVRPHIGGYVVAAWLTAIALNLLTGWIYVDVAVRDLVMAIAAYSMAKISKIV